MSAEHGFGPDPEEVASPVMVEAADHEPEELVASVEAGPALGAERDLELLAKQQVLEDEALTAAEGTSKRGQEEADEFDHPRQDPIVTAPARASEAFAPYTISRAPALEGLAGREPAPRRLMSRVAV
jgi:hypothetical protein